MSFRNINAPLFLIILIQSAIRLYAIILISAKIMKTVGFIAKHAWEGAIYNLLLYLVASHVSLSNFSSIIFIKNIMNQD